MNPAARIVLTINATICNQNSDVLQPLAGLALLVSMFYTPVMPNKKLGKWFNCLTCDTPIYRSPGDQRKAPQGKFYCSKKCRRNPERDQKMRARSILGQAIFRQKINKPNYCSKCKKRCKPHGHHTDYSKPLEVQWLCRACHDVVHYRDRCRAVESRRKYFGDVCICGKLIIAKNMCKSCYAREYEKTRLPRT